MALSKKPVLAFAAPMGSDDEGRKSRILSASEWSNSAVEVLLDTYLQKFSIGRGYLRNKDWEDVVHNVNTRSEGLTSTKTMKQCRDKVDSLKRRYKMEKRKAVSGMEVTWPFFSQLDEMMCSVYQQGKGLDPLDSMHRKSPVDYEDDHAEVSASQGDINMHNMRYGAACNGKSTLDGMDGLSEDGMPHNSYHAPLKLGGWPRVQDSTDYSSEQEKAYPYRNIDENLKAHAHKCKSKSEHPMHALADAVNGFTEVFARIELAKLEILTTMKLEMARLRKKRRRRRKGSTKGSSSYSSE